MATVDDFLSKVSSQVGKPYVWGADNPQTGFDCSGLVYWAAAQAGVPLAQRTTESMYPALPVVDNPGPGNLVFFASPSGDISHVGICTNQGCTQMIDAPNSQSHVRSEPIPGPGGQWGSDVVAGYRAIPGLQGGAGAGIVNATDISIPNPLNAGEDIVKAVGGLLGKLPSIFIDVLTGGKTLGELVFRSLLIVNGSVLVSAGLVMFAITIHRKGDSGGISKDYNQAVSSYRHIQHEQLIAEQHRRGEARRANAIIQRREKEEQHRRGEIRRANAERRLAGQASRV